MLWKRTNEPNDFVRFWMSRMGFIVRDFKDFKDFKDIKDFRDIKDLKDFY